MPDASEAQRTWVKRVLGVERAPPVTGKPDLSAALAGWRQALDALDGQISALQAVLRGAPDEDLHEVAEFGLNAMTGSHKVKIQAALMELQSGDANPRKIGAAAALVESFMAHIASDKRIAACDANPFGVALSIRRTLTPALEGLKAALQVRPG